MRDRLLEQDAVAHALKVAADADVALVGIGGTDDACTMVRSGCLDPAGDRAAPRQGAVGDVLGNYVDVDGEHIVAPHSSRLIGLSIDDLRGIDTVIAVVSGEEKPLAILGVLRAGIVDVLIVDEANGGRAARPRPRCRRRWMNAGGPDPGDREPGVRGAYGVAAINVVNDLTMEAVLAAAEELRSPLIVQTSVKTVKSIGADVLYAMWTAMTAGIDRAGGAPPRPLPGARR